METFMLVIGDEQKGASGWRINEEREKLKKATGKYLFLSILSAPLLLMATYQIFRLHVRSYTDMLHNN